MKQCNTASIIKTCPQATAKGAVQPKYKIARDVKEALSKESPLHGWAIDQLIRSGEWEIYEVGDP